LRARAHFGSTLLEKAVYVASWAYWVACHGTTLPQLWGSDPFSALFFTCYGLIDLFFGLFFLRTSARRVDSKAAGGGS